MRLDRVNIVDLALYQSCAVSMEARTRGIWCVCVCVFDI